MVAEREEQVTEQMGNFVSWDRVRWDADRVKVQLKCDNLLAIRWLAGEWSVRADKYKRRVEAVRNMLEDMADAGMVAPLDGANIFEHVFREGNGYADGRARMARTTGEGKRW